MKRVLLALIRFYRKYISPAFPGKCRFIPTCSEYGLEAIEKYGAPLYEYTPNQVKQAVVGYGGAEKRQVMDMTRRILKMEKVARPDDAADAIAIALCHARSATSLLSRVQET